MSNIRITEAISKLEQLKKEHGDIELHMEIGEDVKCDACGEFRYKMYTGMLKHISDIRVRDSICVYLLADKG